MSAGDALLEIALHVSVAAVVHDMPTGRPVGVELTAPSLTSQNLDEKLGVAPRDPRILRSEQAYTAAHEHVHWCEMAWRVLSASGLRLLRVASVAEAVRTLTHQQAQVVIADARRGPELIAAVRARLPVIEAETR